MTEREHIWKPLRENLTGVHFLRVENTAVTGAPDINGCRGGREIWIEAKIFAGNKIHFRPTQIPWIARRSAHGGTVWILARKDDRLLLYSSRALPILLQQGVAAIDGIKGIRADPMDVTGLAQFSTSKPFDWPALEAHLFGDSINVNG